MTLTLLNTVTKRTYSCEVKDTGGSREYYILSGLILPDGIPDGDYNYTLKDNEAILSTGIIRIGDYVPQDNVTYKGGKQEYIYYKGK